jgi:hypothetical protein
MKPLASEQIRFEVVRTGGFGGLTRSGVLDSSDLATDEARDLAGVLDAVDLDALAGPSSNPSGTGVPDAFHYDVSVSRGGRRWELNLRDPDVPDELRPVIRRALRPPDTT